MKTIILAIVIYLAPAMAALAQSTEALIHEGIIAAPVGKVWASWTTGDGLRSWLAPHAEIDFRIGGRMRTNYQADGRLDDPGTIENTILSYDPYRMISIRVSRAPEGFPFPNAVYDMWTVLYFEPVSPAETRVRVVANGFTDTDESRNMRRFFERGNAAAIQQMQDRIQ